MQCIKGCCIRCRFVVHAGGRGLCRARVPSHAQCLLTLMHSCCLTPAASLLDRPPDGWSATSVQVRLNGIASKPSWLQKFSAQDSDSSSSSSRGYQRTLIPFTQCVVSSHPYLPLRETSTLRIDKVKGCMFVNQYLVVKFLGRGACGKVFLCLNTHDLRLYAMKVTIGVHRSCSNRYPRAIM